MEVGEAIFVVTFRSEAANDDPSPGPGGLSPRRHGRERGWSEMNLQSLKVCFVNALQRSETVVFPTYSSVSISRACIGPFQSIFPSLPRRGEERIGASGLWDCQFAKPHLSFFIHGRFRGAQSQPLCVLVVKKKQCWVKSQQVKLKLIVSQASPSDCQGNGVDLGIESHRVSQAILKVRNTNMYPKNYWSIWFLYDTFSRLLQGRHR